MKYQSTRGSKEKITAAQAITKGLAKDGGLYVPEKFPQITYKQITTLCEKTYSERAAKIMGLFLTEFTPDELTLYAENAYCSFPDAAPLHELDENTRFLELWHGPTAAFKDMALQVMPYLLTASLKKTQDTREVCILVATSGDTGKAALEGFRDVQGTSIMVFYPSGGVSEIQKKQMTTQSGDNVKVVAVNGNFDDTQTGVKKIFTNTELSSELEESGFFLSSANSINWGRLVPQIAYYVSSYCDLIKSGRISCGNKINFCVPTGNFGNILAGYYAYKIGLPIGKLICASNRNDVLTQFINTGVYDKNRKFYTTISPSMDILVSSNLERLLYELSDKDGKIVASYMTSLGEKGQYKVPEPVQKRISDIFASGYCSEEDTLRTISDTWNNHKYLIDTHTAVAYKALSDYRKQTKDDTVTVVISTASPFKFCDSVLKALGQPVRYEGVGLINALASYTGIAAPLPLTELEEKKERFLTVVEKDEMLTAVNAFLEERANINEIEL